MSVTFRYRDLVPDGTSEEFEQLVVVLNKRWSVQHGVSGMHGALTVDSLAANDAVNLLIPWTGTVEWLQGAVYLDGLKTDNHRAMIQPAQWTGNQDDYNPPFLATAYGIEIDTDADRDLTGIFVHRQQKRRLLLANRGNYTVTVKHNSSGSESTFRFAIPTGADYAMSSGELAWFWYDPGSNVWRVEGPQ